MSDQQNPKFYFGNFQEKARPSGDKFSPGSLNLTKLLDELGYEVVKKNKPVPSYIHVSNKGEEFLKVVINKFKDGPNQYGNTHCISVDTFRPKIEGHQTEEEVNGNTN